MSSQKDFENIWIIFLKRELNRRKSPASYGKLLMIIEGHVSFTVTCHLKFSSVNFQVSHSTVHMLILITLFIVFLKNHTYFYVF